MNDNYYETLEIQENASQEVIKAAYKVLAKKYHPDSYKDNSEECANIMVKINEAYDVLSDENKRKEYDKKLKRNINENYQNNNYYKKEESSNIKKDSSKENSSSSSLFYDIIKGVGLSILSSALNNNIEIQNAYMKGMSINNDYKLIKKYKRASGYEKAGYIKAMVEKGILIMDYNGSYRPRDDYKYYF